VDWQPSTQLQPLRVAPQYPLQKLEAGAISGQAVEVEVQVTPVGKGKKFCGD